MIKYVEGITVEELQASYRSAAKIVARYGDAYLPVFKRLHEEVQKLERASEIKTIALSVASAINNPDETV